MTEIILPHLEPWQRDLVNLYDKYPRDKWFSIKARRQVGKSICLEVLLIYSSFKKPNSFSLFVSPVILQARKVFQDVCKMASELIKSANASILEIEFINGSVIKFGSAQQCDSLRGFTIKGSGLLMIDEAAFCSDEAFYQILVPTTNVNKADIFIVSTPKLKQGFFYNLYMKGLEENDKVISVNWNNYDTSKFLSNETLEIYREQMPKLAFQCEFLAEFIDGEGTVFNQFKDCVEDYELNKIETVIGIDWGSGTGSDYTVLSVGQVHENKIKIAYQKAFNDKNANQTIEYIKNEIEALKTQGISDITVVVESNSIGNVYFQLLNDSLDESISLIKFTTTNKSKDRIIKQLILCFEQHKITIPNDSKLLNELSAYECKINQNGLAIYNAPVGLHDDRVMSLAFLVNKLYLEL